MFYMTIGIWTYDSKVVFSSLRHHFPLPKDTVHSVSETLLISLSLIGYFNSFAATFVFKFTHIPSISWVHRTKTKLRYLIRQALFFSKEILSKEWLDTLYGYETPSTSSLVQGFTNLEKKLLLRNTVMKISVLV